MDREAMDGEAMITDTREGAGAHGQTRALWWSCTTGACMHARARDADGATRRRRDSSGHGTERWLCVPPATAGRVDRRVCDSVCVAVRGEMIVCRKLGGTATRPVTELRVTAGIRYDLPIISSICAAAAARSSINLARTDFHVARPRRPCDGPSSRRSEGTRQHQRRSARTAVPSSGVLRIGPTLTPLTARLSSRRSLGFPASMVANRPPSCS